MRIIKNAVLVAVCKSRVTSDERLVFKARIRTGGKRELRYLVCDSMPENIDVAVLNGSGTWTVEHKHSDAPDAKPVYHLVLFEGLDL